MHRSVLLLCLLVLSASTTGAQDLEETLSQLGSTYAQAYTRPLGDALGANLNTGLFHSARVSSNRYGFRVYIGVRAFGSFLTEDDETFDLDYTGHVDLDIELDGEQQRVRVPATFRVDDAPTIFGEDAPAVATVTARVDTSFTRFGVTVPVSFDTTLTQEIVGGVVPTNVVPWFVPHIRVGTAFGTDLMLRWMPSITVTDVGTLSVFGAGVRHSISQYAPKLPLDIAVQMGWQRVSFDDGRWPFRSNRPAPSAVAVCWGWRSISARSSSTQTTASDVST